MCPNTIYFYSLKCNFIDIASNIHICFLVIGSGSDPFIITIKGQYYVTHSKTYEFMLYTMKNISESVVLCHNAPDWSKQ